MSQPTDTPSTPTNAKIDYYINIVDIAGPPDEYGNVHVIIEVYTDADLSDLWTQHHCFTSHAMHTWIDFYAKGLKGVEQ
jgi:hypothetical protein